MNGCLYHGCKFCFPLQRDTKIPLKLSTTVVDIASHNDRFLRTERKRNWLSQQCQLAVTSIWPCQIPPVLRSNMTTLDRKKKNLGHAVLKLEPGMSLYGGRTEVFVNYMERSDEKQLRYVDVCSLYPFVLRSRDYPLGNCEIIRPLEDGISVDAKNLSTYFGVALVKILPPSRLFLPVLPYHCTIGGTTKTVFALCNTCVKNTESVKMISPMVQEGTLFPAIYDLDKVTICPHQSSEERAFIGCWPIPELCLALENSYELLCVYEIWHFPGHSSSLFKDYVTMFAKKKLESSGFPSRVQSQEAKLEYIKSIAVLDKIDLDINKVEFNPGLRAISKLSLNSVWGKWAQGEKRRKKYVTSMSELFFMLRSPGLVVHKIEPMSAECVFVEYSSRDDLSITNQRETQTKEAEEPDQQMFSEQFTNSKINTLIGSFTTSWARCHLYQSISKIPPGDLLLCDTDSALFGEPKGGVSLIPTSGGLGNYEDEIVNTYGNGAT